VDAEDAYRLRGRRSAHSQRRPRRLQRWLAKAPILAGLIVCFALPAQASGVFWGNTGLAGLTPPIPPSIGAANLNGTSVNENFITAPSSSTISVAVDGSHIYWTDQPANSIGRANLDGTGVNDNFITGTAGNSLTSIAVDSGHIYWGIFGQTTSAIARANLDGSGGNENFITINNSTPGGDTPGGIASRQRKHLLDTT
jgi:hypothetical protein